MPLGIGARCRKQRLGEGGTIRFRKTETNLAIFIYRINSGLVLRRRLSEMVPRLSRPDQILSPERG